MKLQKVNPENNLQFINLYKDRSLNELQLIHPNWAYGKNVDRLFDYLQNPINNEVTIFLVETAELIIKSDFDEVNPNILFTGDPINDYRVARILYRWENNDFVDPPSIGVCSSDLKKLSFSDGRHRTKSTYLLGIREIPIAVYNCQIDQIARIIKLGFT